jgi:hypothetical protein
MATTIPNAPRVETAAPSSQPAGYGLLAGAQVVPAPEQMGLFGVDWEPGPVQVAKFWAQACAGAPPATKTFFDRPDRKMTDPFVIYWGEECGSVAFEGTDARVREGLAQGEARPIEGKVWQALFADADTVDLDTARGLVDAVGHVEEELGARYGVRGLIHAPARVAAHAFTLNLIRWRGETPLSPRGHTWVFGDGYDPASGSPPTDGSSIVGTAPMVLWRTPVATIGPVLDHHTNRYVAVAERIYLAGWVGAAVRIALPLGA